MAETHRAYVAYICGVPFATRDSKIIASLLKMSTRLPRLEVLPDGTLATMTEADERALVNQMVTRVEVADVVCTECEEHGGRTEVHSIPLDSELGNALKAAIDKMRRRDG